MPVAECETIQFRECGLCDRLVKPPMVYCDRCVNEMDTTAIPEPKAIRNSPTANDRQVGGSHYRNRGRFQHWDFAASRNYDYFQGVITKYVDRWKEKNGLEDLRKAQHYLEKYIEEIERGVVHDPTRVAKNEIPQNIDLSY